MASNPEPLGLSWNEKFVQLLEAVEICSMQCRLKSTQDWAAFLHENPHLLFMQINSYIHYNTGMISLSLKIKLYISLLFLGSNL